GPAGEAAVATLRQIVGEYPFTERYLDLITEAYGADATFSEAFAATLSGALEDRGYAWLDASGAAVKSAASELYLAMLDASEAILEADDRGRAAIRDAGHEAPIARLDGALPIFVDGPDGRARLIVDGDRIRSGRGGAIGSVTEWRSRLRDEPERFSPNVASRPALESYLLPVAATVLGPGEIAYWSQLPPLFEALDVPFPAVHPRAAWTVIEPNIRRLLEKLDLDPDGLADGGAEASRALTEAARPETVETELEGLRALAAGRMDGLEAAVGEQLPGLKAAVGKTRKAIAKAVDQLARQVDQDARGRLDVQLGQIRRCAAHLFPGRRPQERVLSPIPYLARHGAALIDDLAERTDAWLAASLAGPGDDG
ncbi:MAG: bacillithiol biosynthesis BshC, partial [Gemmatimonadetes bacterium]|nr:bacillithiol biosynthesis BshC [Gemmatimonadota bacterium]